jgi:hypothetical protein
MYLNVLRTIKRLKVEHRLIRIAPHVIKHVVQRRMRRMIGKRPR